MNKQKEREHLSIQNLICLLSMTFNLLLNIAIVARNN